MFGRAREVVLGTDGGEVGRLWCGWGGLDTTSLGIIIPCYSTRCYHRLMPFSTR